MNNLNFRAWDKRFKRFDYGGGALLLRHNSEDFEEVQQSTGLKDKNKKLIFEGDILKRDNSIMKLGYDVVSIFRSNKSNTMFFGTKQWNEFIHDMDTNRFEIIGNIYTTPELLSKK